MALSRYRVRNYRSLVDVSLELGRITVLAGANGSGKTNLYRALRLVRHGSQGELARALLEEGGMPSVLYAGRRPQRKGEPVRMVVGVTLDDWSYELALGLPQERESRFRLDPEVKQELVWVGSKQTPRSTIADRSGTTAILTDADGARVTMAATLDPAEPVLAQLSDPVRFPELFALRLEFGRWRFYHEFPTGQDAPARRPQPGVRTPVLGDDGSDLAAALATIHEIGDRVVLDDAIAAAFPGSRLDVEAHDDVFSLAFQQPGLLRPTRGAELSDGTLRFLYLAAALLTPRPPGLLVLNEPEAGLHGPVLDPLADLIHEASRHSQILVTTHSEHLAGHLSRHDAATYTLTRSSNGTTTAQPHA
jgi:predicted ATPase